MKKATKGIPHVYERGMPTRSQIDAFADDTFEAQQRALSELRVRADDDDVSIQLGLTAVLVSVLVAIMPGLDLKFDGGPWWAIVTFAAVIAIALVVAGIPIMIPLLLGSAKRARAVRYLSHYEAELERRHRQTGWAASVWRRDH